GGGRTPGRWNADGPMTRALLSTMLLLAGCQGFGGSISLGCRAARLDVADVPFEPIRSGAPDGVLVRLAGGPAIPFDGDARRLALHLVACEPDPEPALVWHTPIRPDPARATADWTGPAGVTGVVGCEPATAREWCEDVLDRIDVERRPGAHS